MRINRSLLNWGVFLIALGGVPLAVQQGWANAGIAGDLWRLWPLILVGIGLGLILRWTPLAWFGGALVAGTFGLIFGALVAGGISGISGACIGPASGATSTTEESGPASAGTFRLDLELSCGDLEIARATSAGWTVSAEHGADDPPSIEGTADGLSIHQDDEEGFLAFAQRTRNTWTVGLPASAPVAVDVTLNAADGQIDLGAAPLDSLNATFNASETDIDLASATTPQPARLGLTYNASSGTLSLPEGSLIGGATLNASSLDVCIPTGAEVRIELQSTLSSNDIEASGLTRSGDGWQSDGYDTASTRIDLSFTTTVSSLSFARAEVCP